MKQAAPVTPQHLQQFLNTYNKDLRLKAMTNALSQADMANLVYHTEAGAKMRHKFSVDIETMKVTNQKSSGRCWLFAALNVLREKIAKEKNLEDFELSQSYAAFWDKFERANYFLESILDTADREVDDRTVTYILQTGVHDGGQWDMFVNIVDKYGVIPKDAMPETYQSSNTNHMNGQLNERLRQGAACLRKMTADKASAEALQQEKNKILEEIFCFLTACYGCPPETFDFEYVDKDKKYHVETGLTAKTFTDKYVGGMLEETASVIHAPTADKPLNQVYTVQYLGNVVGGKDVRYLNLSMEEMKAAIIAQLKDGEVVWFGSDVSKFGSREGGIWDDQCMDYRLLTGMNLEMSKTDRLDYRDSAMCHAMVITGVNLRESDGKPDRWKIENSWGDKSGNKGYYVMSDSWFDLFVYQAVVNKKYLGDRVNLLSQEPVVLKPWDPMGSLAD